MKKFNIILLLASFFLLASCEKEDRTYNGPLYVEFSAEQYGQQASITSNIFKTPDDIGADKIGVQLIGYGRSEPLTVNFRLVDQVFYIVSLSKYVVDLPDGLKPSEYKVVPATAVYNTDYTFDGLSGVTFDKTYGRGSITIAPNSQFGVIPINILQKGGKLLFFALEDGNGLMANKPTALLYYQTPIDKQVVFLDQFASDPLTRGWTAIDKDGDGRIWFWESSQMWSYSYRSVPLTPENYLVTPMISIPTTDRPVLLTFEIAGRGSVEDNDYREQYKVIISENPITTINCRDADIVQDYVEITAANSDSNFGQVELDLSAYQGKDVYISIVHGNCVGQWTLKLRNFELSIY